MKKGVALKILGEKSCDIKGGGQQMAAMMLMLINFNNAQSRYLNLQVHRPFIDLPMDNLDCSRTFYKNYEAAMSCNQVQLV